MHRIPVAEEILAPLLDAAGHGVVAVLSGHFLGRVYLADGGVDAPFELKLLGARQLALGVTAGAAGGLGQ